MIFLRLNPKKPTIAEPNNQIAAGTGTGDAETTEIPLAPTPVAFVKAAAATKEGELAFLASDVVKKSTAVGCPPEKTKSKVSLIVPTKAPTGNFR
jgi:hypothetical protein